MINNELKESIQIVKNANIDDLYLSEIGFNTSKKAGCCPVHNGDNKTGFSYTENNGERQYTCWTRGNACIGEGSDIINICKVKENLSNQYQAVKFLADKYNIDVPINNSNAPKLQRVDKNKIVEFYENKVNEAIQEGDLDKALEISGQVDEISSKSYFAGFPYVDSKNSPLKIWENLEAILDRENVYAVYNQITKDNEIKNLNCEGLSNQLMDIHSMANKYGFKVSLDFIGKSISRIAEKNKYNPVVNFLNECEFHWDEQKGRIDQLCDTLEIPSHFSKDLRNMLVTKWLLNVASIPFNEGNNNTEGVLVIQGGQGIGKTTWIKELIPLYLKTGLDLDPSDKDKIYNCIKYWVVELGELDATMKSDQAKLKAFLTESVDEIRRPYAVAPERYPRKTAFYGTVNKEEFLKDETGDRRYWVIPVDNINIEAMRKIDIPQLWGEVMHLLKSNTIKLNLSKEEHEMLNLSNKDFRVKDLLQITVETGFNWDSDKKYWNVVSSSEIASKLGLKSTRGLKEAIESMGGEYKKTNKVRGYIVPPFKNSMNPISWEEI